SYGVRVMAKTGAAGKAAQAARSARYRVIEGDRAGAEQAGGGRGAGLVARFLDAEGRIVIDRVAEGCGMSKLQLAETIGLRKEAMYRAARLEAPKTQARATEMLEIVGRVADWAGGEKQAMAWYRAEP